MMIAIESTSQRIDRTLIPICRSCGHPVPIIQVSEVRNSGTYRFSQLEPKCKTYRGRWVCPNCPLTNITTQN
jgi:hypothetical protein